MFEEIRAAVLRVIAHVEEETTHHRKSIQEVMEAVMEMNSGLSTGMKEIKSYLSRLKIYLYILYAVVAGIIGWIIFG